MSTQNRNPLTRRSVPVNLILTVAIVLVAVLVIGGILLFKGSDDKGSATTPSGDPTQNAALLRNPNSHTLTTAPGDKVTVVEFLDFQCPACVGYYNNITKKLESDYAGRITFVPRNFPLSMHPLAVPAAQAAEAAANQGKYQEMYHALYDGYDTWALTPDGQGVSSDQAKATTTFATYAQQIGLDMPRYTADLTSPDTKARIDKDAADGTALGVTGTPTIFINGTRYTPQGKTFADVNTDLRSRLDTLLK